MSVYCFVYDNVPLNKKRLKAGKGSLIVVPHNINICVYHKILLILAFLSPHRMNNGQGGIK